jgi:hypothetical protein
MIYDHFPLEIHVICEGNKTILYYLSLRFLFIYDQTPYSSYFSTQDKSFLRVTFIIVQ